MLTKYAKAEIVDVKSSATRIKAASLNKFASYDDYRTDDGYLYVRVRAISSRVNKNHDGWPSTELQKSWRSFIGKPIFVDHHNTDPKKARGVVVDASLHVEDDIQKVAALDPYYASAPDEHLPPTYIELLLEVDAKSFPRLAKAIIDDDIDSVSMGANVERSICSHCKNEARNPDEFCDHVRSKGALYEKTDKHGKKTASKSYEDCYDIGFFEISFVFDPADTTALVEKDSLRHARVAAAVHAEVGETLEINVLDFKDSATADAFQSEVMEMVKTASLPISGQCVGCGSPTSGAEMCDTCTAGQGSMVPGSQQGLVPSPTMGQPGQPGRMAFNSEDDADTFGAEPWERFKPGQRVERAAAGGPAKAGVIERVDPNGMGGAMFMVQWDDGRSEYVGDGHLRAERPLTLDQMGDTPEQMQHMVQHAKTAERNPPPQSDMQTAPDKVDTLRQELTCPVCGSTMSDGVCEICSHEEPPEGFDNPDLSKAREVDEEMRQQEAESAAAEQGQGQAAESMQPPDSAQSQGPGRAMASTTTEASPTSVMGDGTKTAAGEGSGRINVRERPILPPTRKNSDKPKNVQVVNDHHKPVESNTRGADMSEHQKTADGTVATDPDKRVDPNGSGAALTDVSPDKVVDVTGTGGVMPVKEPDHQSVDKAVNVTGEKTKTWSENKNAPGVTPEVGDFNTVKSHEVAAAKVPGPDVKDMPDTLDVTKPIGAEGTVGEGTKTWHKDENAPAVTPEASPNTVNLHGSAVAEGRRHAIASMKLAEAEVEMGLIDSDAKFDRVAELEAESAEALEAQIATLSKVRTAGLRKPGTSKRVSSASRIPSLRGGIRTASSKIDDIDPDSPEADAAIFLG